MKQFYLFLTVISLIGFSGKAQQLISVSPSTGNAGETLDVTITGSGTHFTDPQGTTVDFGFNPGSNTTYINSISIIDDQHINANITIPANTMTNEYNSKTINSIDGLLILPYSFHVNGINPPTLTQITPSTAEPGETLTVSILGNSTHFVQGQSNLQFSISPASGTITVNSVTVVSESELTANITVGNNTILGDYPFYINTSGTIATSNQNIFLHVNGYTTTTILSITPFLLNAGETINILTTSQHSYYTQEIPIQDFGFGPGVGVNSSTAVNDTTLITNFTVPSNAISDYYNYSETSSINGTATKYHATLIHGNNNINHPYITISPNNGNAGETLNVTITGVNTHFTQATTTNGYLHFIQLGNNINNPYNLNITNSTIVNDNTITGQLVIPQNTTESDYNLGFNEIGTTNGYYETYFCFHVNGASVLSMDIQPNSTSADGVCDGSVTITPLGGFSPYDVVVNNTPGMTLQNLCEGTYNVTVTDASNQQANMQFIISDPSDLYTTTDYIDSSIIDTLYTSYITNCNIDYTSIDSININQTYLLANQQVLIIWNIYSSVGTTSISNTYTLPENNGIYSFALQLYCPYRSTPHFITAIDQVRSTELRTATLETIEALVFPNPFDEELLIQLKQNEKGKILIFDLMGKTIYTNTFEGNEIKISDHNFESGQYILFVEGEGSTLIKKIRKR